jgi:thiol-disulfide isomerase/thioredoxin
MRVHLYICILALLLAGCKDSEIQKVKLTELDGKQIDLSEFEGKIVFINFWATWCAPCIKEMPSIDLAQNSLKEKDIVFLMASNEDTGEIEEFIKRRSYKFHYVRLLNMEELKVPALPTTHIYDEDGKLKFAETGARDWNEPDNLNLIISNTLK